MKTIKHIALLLVAGFIVLCGVRAAEWLIPAPATRIIVCYAAKNAEPLCMPLDELRQVLAAEDEK